MFIEFKDVSFKYYGSDEYVFNQLSFAIEKGSMLAILGHNGSGKSTIAKLMMGLLETTSGDIYIEGETYLEVEKDQSRPFFVHTKDFDVSVLGTKFNVSAYKEDLQKSVVLVEGSVEVGSDNNKYK